jgi:hypothetical protein
MASQEDIFSALMRKSWLETATKILVCLPSMLIISI